MERSDGGGGREVTDVGGCGGRPSWLEGKLGWSERGVGVEGGGGGGVRNACFGVPLLRERFTS